MDRADVAHEIGFFAEFRGKKDKRGQWNALKRAMGQQRPHVWPRRAVRGEHEGSWKETWNGVEEKWREWVKKLGYARRRFFSESA